MNAFAFWEIPFLLKDVYSRIPVGNLKYGKRYILRVQGLESSLYSTFFEKTGSLKVLLRTRENRPTHIVLE